MGNAPFRSLAPAQATSASSMNRAELLAGLAFLESSHNPSWDAPGLCAWFDEHLVQTGCMMTPVVVTEVSAGTVALHGSSAQGIASHSRLPTVLTAARIRVITAIRGLLASPIDDRFLTAAIFTGQVRRTRIDRANRWVVRPEPTSTLSSIVLSLFAADVLAHRETYDRSLSVCDSCDRVTFVAATESRTSCAAHLPSSSGVIRRVTPSYDSLDSLDSFEAVSATKR